MTRLWILLAACLAIALIIEYRDQSLEQDGQKRRERFFTFILILVLGFFCGLRVWGNDTVTYFQIYEIRTPVLSEFFKRELPSFAIGPGFYFVNSLIKTLGFSTQDYLMFYAFATAIPYVLFVRRYSANLAFGVFLMLATGFYTFSLAAIKQCMAIGICLWAVMAAIDKKWIRFFLLVGLASLFHPYALVYLLVPFMFFKPWTPRTYIYIVLFVLTGFYLNTLIGTVIDITAMMGADYSADEFMQEGVNIFRVLVSFVPLAVSVFYRDTLFKHSTRSENLMFNLAMLNALIMFVGLFGTANYFARLANYFLPAQVIVLPWMLQKLPQKDRNILIPASIVGYTGYFIYENAIIRPFDTGYPQMSFWKYLSNTIRGVLS